VPIRLALRIRDSALAVAQVCHSDVSLSAWQATYGLYALCELLHIPWQRFHCRRMRPRDWNPLHSISGGTQHVSYELAAEVYRQPSVGGVMRRSKREFQSQLDRTGGRESCISQNRPFSTCSLGSLLRFDYGGRSLKLEARVGGGSLTPSPPAVWLAAHFWNAATPAVRSESGACAMPRTTVLHAQIRPVGMPTCRLCPNIDRHELVCPRTSL